jgi:hypothetical protein
VTIEPLPADHLRLGCDTADCTAEIVAHGVTEGELLDRAKSAGWSIAPDVGLHFCPLTQVHECDVCGALAQESITHLASGETTYYCAAHWPL